MISVVGGRIGFYSNVIWYLAHCHIAERHNDKIEYKSFSPYYSNDIENGFYQFFENITNDINYNGFKFNDIYNVENIMMYKSTEICGFILDFKMRRYMNYLIKKYLTIKPHILNRIKEHSIHFENRKVLGVHIRQTDLYTSDKDNKLDKPITLEKYFLEIDNQIHNYDLLYLMSDNKESIEIFSKKYKNSFYVKDVFRSEKINDDLLLRTNHTLDKYKFGEDIIVETELLSKCDKVLITNSNISNFTLINNPNISFQYLDLDLSDELLKKYYDVLKNGI